VAVSPVRRFEHDAARHEPLENPIELRCTPANVRFE
jgi:hypothetical protein